MCTGLDRPAPTHTAGPIAGTGNASMSFYFYQTSAIHSSCTFHQLMARRQHNGFTLHDFSHFHYSINYRSADSGPSPLPDTNNPAPDGHSSLVPHTESYKLRSPLWTSQPRNYYSIHPNHAVTYVIYNVTVVFYHNNY